MGAFNFLLLRKLRQLLQGGLENPWDGSMGFFPVENGDFPRGKFAVVRIWKEIFNEKKGFMVFWRFEMTSSSVSNEIY